MLGGICRFATIGEKTFPRQMCLALLSLNAYKRTFPPLLRQHAFFFHRTLVWCMRDCRFGLLSIKNTDLSLLQMVAQAHNHQGATPICSRSEGNKFDLWFAVSTLALLLQLLYGAGSS